jgi:hypothetical protein
VRVDRYSLLATLVYECRLELQDIRHGPYPSGACLQRAVFARCQKLLLGYATPGRYQVHDLPRFLREGLTPEPVQMPSQ